MIVARLTTYVKVYTVDTVLFVKTLTRSGAHGRLRNPGCTLRRTLSEVGGEDREEYYG